MLGPLFEAFAELNVATARVVYDDDSVDDVRAQLLGLDGVLVWVNPIQDGANRRQLDGLLRDVSSRGVWVSAHPDVVARMGTKEVLFHTRSLGWGTDTDLYQSPRDLAERLPDRLRRDRRVVVKQARGTAGNGVWRLDLAGSAIDSSAIAAADNLVRVVQANAPEFAAEEVRLEEFIDRLTAYFEWSGSVVVQPYQSRLAEGMVRCYLAQDQVVGFCHQYPHGLLDELEGEPRQRGPMEDADTPAYEALRLKAESEWVPRMRDLLALETRVLPVIWDADFFFGPKDPTGLDTYVLCEINISAVWPYPTQASRTIAEKCISAIEVAKSG
jgi:hypothetical protein